MTNAEIYSLIRECARLEAQNARLQRKVEQVRSWEWARVFAGSRSFGRLTWRVRGIARLQAKVERLEAEVADLERQLAYPDECSRVGRMPISEWVSAVVAPTERARPTPGR
jgi:hypothetical protein